MQGDHRDDRIVEAGQQQPFVNLSLAYHTYCLRAVSMTHVFPNQKLLNGTC